MPPASANTDLPRAFNRACPLVSLAGNPSTPTTVLENLAKRDDYYLSRELAGNPSTPATDPKNLAKRGVPVIDRQLAGNQSTPATVLENIAKRYGWNLNREMAENPSGNQRFPRLLIMLRYLAADPRLPPEKM